MGGRYELRLGHTRRVEGECQTTDLTPRAQSPTLSKKQSRNLRLQKCLTEFVFLVSFVAHIPLPRSPSGHGLTWIFFVDKAGDARRRHDIAIWGRISLLELWFTA